MVGMLKKIKKKSNAKSNLAVVGRYIFPPEIFSKIEKSKAGFGKEIQITDAIASLMNNQAVQSDQLSIIPEHMFWRL